MADHHHASGDYHKGSQDIHEQEASFDLFVTLTKWGCLFLASTLTTAVIWTCVKGAGPITAIFVGVVIAFVGVLALKKPATPADH